MWIVVVIGIVFELDYHFFILPQDFGVDIPHKR